MVFYNPTTQEILNDVEELKEKLYPSTLPAEITDEKISFTGWYILNKTTAPVVDDFHNAELDGATYTDGKYYMKWKIVDKYSDIDVVKTRKKEIIKKEANEKILEIADEIKQRNLLATGLNLQHIGPSNWSAEEEATSDAILAIWAQIKAIRDESDIMEASVDSATSIQDVIDVDWS